MKQEKLQKRSFNDITLEGAVRLGKAILITAHDDLIKSYCTIQKIRVKHCGKITKGELNYYMEKIWELQRNEHFYIRQDGMFKVLVPHGEGQRVIDMIREEANYCYDDKKFIKRCEKLWQNEMEKQKELERKQLEQERAKKEAFRNAKRQEVLSKIEKTLNSNNARLIKSLKTKIFHAIVFETNLARYFTEQENREHIKMLNDKLDELREREREKYKL